MRDDAKLAKAVEALEDDPRVLARVNPVVVYRIVLDRLKDERDKAAIGGYSYANPLDPEMLRIAGDILKGPTPPA